MQRPVIAFFILSAMILAVRFTPALAQSVPSSGTKNAINGINSYPGPEFVKYAREREPADRRIDLFLSDWQGSLPRVEHGSLMLRDILIRGDNFAPSQKSAVLRAANFLAYGRLAPGDSTTPSTLQGQQEVYYVLGGEGEIQAGGDTAKLRKDIAVLMPAGLEFVMKCSDAQPLTMYVINEPTPSGFHPKDRMMVKDEAAARQRTPAAADPYIVGGASGHWAHVVRELFSPADGLATEQSVITVTINPLTLGEPHPHRPGQEEVWAAIDGSSLMMMGTELRIQKPGMAYMLPPDAATVHSNINVSDQPVKFLYFARFPEGENYTHAVPPAHQ
ncbi:MAG TPA: cupin domain-containing protein [Blastocatellia bacterium]|nr:cupin domain-containing protein [Blastocatellia bacterium]